MLRWRAQHLAVEGLAWRAECQKATIFPILPIELAMERARKKKSRASSLIAFYLLNGVPFLVDGYLLLNSRSNVADVSAIGVGCSLTTNMREHSA